MRARYDEPTSGRFLSEDTAQDGLNWFVYATNEPVDCVDPTGNFTLIEIIGTARDQLQEYNQNFQSKMAALGAAGTSISSILTKYADKYGEALGEDFELVFTSGNRVWITGIDRGHGYQVALDFASGIVKAYGPGGQMNGLPPGVPHWEPFSNLLH